MNEQEFVSKMERFIQEEKYGEVLFQVDENLKNYPDSPILLHLKGVAHGYAQQHDKALQCFTRLSEIFPDVAQVWYQLSCALTELERIEESVEILKKAYKLDPNEPSIVFNLGVQLLETNNNPEEALTYLKRADMLGHRRACGIISEIENNKS